MKENWLFVTGWIAHFCYSNMIMDFVGKEKYLKLANEFWVDTTSFTWIGIFLIWLFASLLYALIMFRLKVYQKIAEKLTEVK